MPRFHHVAAVCLLSLVTTACQSADFVPGPGMSYLQQEPDAAQCRLFARGMDRGYEFDAAGPTREVAAYMAAAALGEVIGTVVERNQNFNDCMEAKGWRIADRKPAVVATAAARPGNDEGDDPQPRPLITRTAVRLSLGVSGTRVDALMAEKNGLPIIGGFLVKAVQPGSVAFTAQIIPGDIILTVGDRVVGSGAEIGAALTEAVGRPATVILYRDRQPWEIVVQL